MPTARSGGVPAYARMDFGTGRVPGGTPRTVLAGTRTGPAGSVCSGGGLTVSAALSAETPIARRCRPSVTATTATDGVGRQSRAEGEQPYETTHGTDGLHPGGHVRGGDPSRDAIGGADELRPGD